MKRIIKVIIILIVFSCFYFPFSLRSLPGYNSKMFVALIGLAFWGWTQLKNMNLSIDRDMLRVTILAILFSLQCLFSTVYNSTEESAYIDYVVSMWVWLGGAYSVIYLIRRFHGFASMYLIFYYMALLCSFHCILAILIDNIPVLQQAVVNVVAVNTDFFDYAKRIYSIGVATDTAGIRFSCALLGVGWLIRHRESDLYGWLFILLFLVIAIIGNVISRTTLVGVVVAAFYLLLSTSWVHCRITDKKIYMLVSLVLLCFVTIWTVIYLYNHNPSFHHYFRYGFEAFFNYFEEGTWSTNSTDRLFGDMVVFPDNLKTWIVGDGYFADPIKGFYMHTDIGYLRIIFLCGLIGLMLFLSYFIYMTYVLCKREKRQVLFFIFLFIIQLVVWVKISTDIFPIYALLLILDKFELKSAFRNLKAISYDT